MKISNEWKDYECISAGNGEKLERWGNVILRRPDPQAMWPIENNNLWNNVDAFTIALIKVVDTGTLKRNYLNFGQ